MNVLIIATNRSVHPQPVMPIGGCVVAEACERTGHRVRVLDLMFEKEPPAALRAAVASFRPDVVGLSVRNIDNNDMRDPVFFLDDLPRLVNTVRELTDAPLVLGGAAVGVMPEAILRHAGVSCGVVADGEQAFPRLLKRLEGGEPLQGIPGLALLDQGAYHPAACRDDGSAAACAAPDYHRWVEVPAYRSLLAPAPVQTKLGCAFRCIYCTYRRLEGGPYRLAGAGEVVDAVARLAVSGMGEIEFVDSVFNAPRDHALGLCEELARAGHPARLQSMELNPLHLDEGLLRAMERAGFVGIGVTAESAVDEVLQGLGKGFTSREVHGAAEAVRRSRLPCAWIFLLGGPGETRETVRETLRFARRTVRPQDAAFFNVGIRIYPNTELDSLARRQGYFHLPPSEMLQPVFYVSPEVSPAWIMDEVRRSMAGCMNFINADSIGLSFLPSIHRLAYRLGVKPPLWRHTRTIRRGLRMLGMDV